MLDVSGQPARRTGAARLEERVNYRFVGAWASVGICYIDCEQLRAAKPIGRQRLRDSLCQRDSGGMLAWISSLRTARAPQPFDASSRGFSQGCGR